MIDIAERLRLYARHFEDLHAPQNVTIAMREAADKIEHLREEAEFNYMAGYDAAKDDYRDMLQERENEIENLRLALEVAANDLDDWGAYTKAKNARAALEGE